VAALPDLDVTVLFYARGEADRDWGEVTGEDSDVHVEFLPGRAFRVRGRRSLFFHWNPGIARRLREGAFDVVVIPGWSMPSSLAAARACHRREVPYVIFSETHARSPRPRWVRALKQPLLRRVVGRASAWLATGSLSADYLVAHGAVRERIFRFANTPDVPALRAAVAAARPERDAVRADLGVPADAGVTLFVGRLIGAKDPAVLVRAQAALEQEPDAPWLLLVGDGPLRRELEALVEEHRLERVRFAGNRLPAELPALWAAADVFALPSRHEPWGVVVNEAMAAGLPVVLSDRVGAAADLLVDGRNGRLVEHGSAPALAAALRELHGDPALRRRMAGESEKIVADWGYEPSVEGFREAVRAAAEAAR
jgi:glycosyltransferase involved in cell wall biosynthesis